jgi:hypothetical protein
MKAKRLLMLAKHSISKSWGPNSKYAKWAYTGIIRPALSYVSLVWSRVCDNQTIILKLKQVQLLRLLQIAPVRRSTPTAGLEIIYNIEPLDLFIREAVAKAFVRVEPKFT